MSAEARPESTPPELRRLSAEADLLPAVLLKPSCGQAYVHAMYCHACIFKYMYMCMYMHMYIFHVQPLR